MGGSWGRMLELWWREGWWVFKGVDMEEGVRFGVRVLVWRWRWLMAWELAVFRAIHTVKVTRRGDLEDVVSFTEGGIVDEDNDCQTLVRALRWSERFKDDRRDGELWRTLCGDKAHMYYGRFLHEFWMYWYVDLYRAWEARYTPEGRRRRAEGRWRRDRKVGKVWWRWGRRMEGPPHFGHRERWWRWLAVARVLMVAMEEGRLVCWGWVSWVEAVERGKEVARGRDRQQQVEGHSCHNCGRLQLQMKWYIDGRGGGMEKYCEQCVGEGFEEIIVRGEEGFEDDGEDCENEDDSGDWDW